MRGRNICGGVPELTAAFLTLDHGADQGGGAIEEAGCEGGLPGGDRLPDAGTLDRLPFEEDRRRLSYDRIDRRVVRTEEFGGADPVLSESSIVAQENAARSECVLEDLAGEGFGRGGGKGGIEFDDDRFVDPLGFEEVESILQRQNCGWGVAGEDRSGVGIEGENDRSGSDLPGPGDCRTQEGSVPEVNPVEDAEGDDRAWAVTIG